MDEYKDKLLSTVAHDLRNPLNSMIYLIDQAATNQNQQFAQDELDILKGNSKILMALINDILDYCQYKNEKFRLIIETFNLSEMINELFQTMNIMAKLKHLCLVINNQLPNDFEINSDRRRLTQILMNLISNALKFTKNGEIKIKIKKLNNLISFKVKDTGSGMTKEILNKLGGEYNTFGQQNNQNKEGIGLGLYISKQIISILGPDKTFQIKSELEKGSQFSFKIFENYSLQIQSFKEFDLINSSYNSQKSFNENKEKIYFPSFNLIHFTNNQTHFSYQFKSSNDSFKQFQEQQKNVNILIVDDNPFNLFVLKKQLLQLNNQFTIFEANNGQEAVEMYFEKSDNQVIQLILMDCQMPILNGYEATKIIKNKAQEINSQVRIIGNTAYLTEEEIEKCFSFGMDVCLLKPTSETILFNTINQQLSEIFN